jgi:Sulfotransferase domain
VPKLGGRSYPLVLKRAIRPAVVRIRYAGLRPHDVMLASYPRSGSTWFRFLLTESLTGRSAEWSDVNRAIPYVGGHRDAPPLLADGGRLVKTHDRAPGPCARAILIARDPRDVVVSEYRWYARGGYEGDLETFLRSWLQGGMSLFGSWAENTRFWLDGGLAPDNLHVVRFEDLRSDPFAATRDALAFAGASVSDAAVRAAVDGNTIERSREKESRAGTDDVKQHSTGVRFVGEGAVEAWKTKLTEQQTRRVEAHAGDLLARLRYDATR